MKVIIWGVLFGIAFKLGIDIAKKLEKEKAINRHTFYNMN